MKTIARITLAVALGTAASGTPLLSQAATPMVLASAISTAGASETSYDPAAVQVRFDRADELSLRGRFAAARREYRAIVAMQRSHNVLPVEALWRLANDYNAEGSWEQAAAMMHDLADDAERFGNPQVQAQALLEATILYSKARMPQEARVCVKRMEPLLASPHITDEFRQQVQRRITSK